MKTSRKADHDLGYKRLFSHPDLIRDLLIGFVREPWVAELDFTTLEKYPTVFVGDQLQERRDDVIWRVRWGPEWLYIYILLEFQSQISPYMAVRFLGYLGLLYQDLIDGKQVAAGERLPPVLPVVLYNGQRPWTAAVEVADLIAPGPVGLERYRPRLRYLLIEELAYADADLAAMRNLAAALFRLENSRDPEQIREVLTALAAWLNAPEQADLRHAFVIWLKQVFFQARLPGVPLPELNDLEEMRAMLAERLVEWTRDWKQQGLQEGLQEGLQKGLQEGLQEGLQKGLQEGLQKGEIKVLRRLLQRRFGELPPWVEPRLTGASVAELDRWTDRVLDAATLEAVFAEPER